MRSRLFLVAVICGTALAHAQEAAPSPEPSATPAATPESNAPKMTGAVDLTQTSPAENMEIPPPPGEESPDKAAEITGRLPDEDETAPTPPVSGTDEVTAADAGKTVRVAVGNLVGISLESNPSTGYTWELRDFDYGVADFYKSETVAGDSGNVLFGAPAKTIITLQAVKPGMQDIKLVYRRIWEAPDQVAQTFEFRLAVDDAKAPTGEPSPAPEASPAP